MISLLIGLLTVGAGLWGMIHWRDALVLALKGLVPVSMVLGGAVAVIAGISAIRRPPASGSSR